VVHADWSTRPSKRWQSAALLQVDGRYKLLPAVRTGTLPELFGSFGDDRGRVLLGFDFPLGLPAAYARRAGVDDFAAALPRFGSGRFARFYDVAERVEQISLERPFYPQRPGGRRRQELLDALGFERWCQLLRRCDLASPTRPAACALFWTLGGSQVGKAAIAGWRDLLAPALRAGVDVGLWPFQGRLAELIARHRFTVVETYPGEVYDHLGLVPALRRDGGKRSKAARHAAGKRLLCEARRLDVAVEPAARAEIEDGFGGGADGEDRFDAVVGLLGMLGVVRGRRAPGAPDDPVIRRVEGWILGQQA
jgi:hypothetical protein